MAGYKTQTIVCFGAFGLLPLTFDIIICHLDIVNVYVIVIASIGNTQISILLLCFLYLFVGFMVTMYAYILFISESFKSVHTLKHAMGRCTKYVSSSQNHTMIHYHYQYPHCHQNSCDKSAPKHSVRKVHARTYTDTGARTHTHTNTRTLTHTRTHAPLQLLLS